MVVQVRLDGEVFRVSVLAKGNDNVVLSTECPVFAPALPPDFRDRLSKVLATEFASMMSRWEAEQGCWSMGHYPRNPWAVRPWLYFAVVSWAESTSAVLANFFIAALTAAADTPSPRASADWCG